MSNFAEDELNNFGFAGGIEEKPSSASAANTCTFFIVIKKMYCTIERRGVELREDGEFGLLEGN